MTREEAIQNLIHLKSGGGVFVNINEAIDLAIEALNEYKTFCGVDIEEAIKVMENYNKTKYEQHELPQYAEWKEPFNKMVGEDVEFLTEDDYWKMATDEPSNQVTSKLESVEIPTVADEESTMSQPNSKLDLISREDAIAYIERVINSGLGRNKSLDYIHKYISALPSAETHEIRTETHGVCSDLISRKDAEKAIYWNTIEVTSEEMAKGILKDVPSADIAFIPVPKNCAECWEKCLHVAVDCNAKGDNGWDGDKRAEDCPIARPQGEWIGEQRKDKYVEFTIYKCSACGIMGGINANQWNYCPNCGADMRGGERERKSEDKITDHGGR